MACKMCNERGQTWSGGAPKCSFENGVFSNEGWMCATANALRDLLPEPGQHDYSSFRTRCDDDSLGVLWVPEFGFIVMTWYKDRGRTGQIYYMMDEGTPRPLKLSEAESAIEIFTKEKATGPAKDR